MDPDHTRQPTLFHCPSVDNSRCCWAIDGAWIRQPRCPDVHRGRDWFRRRPCLLVDIRQLCHYLEARERESGRSNGIPLPPPSRERLGTAGILRGADLWDTEAEWLRDRPGHLNHRACSAGRWTLGGKDAVGSGSRSASFFAVEFPAEIFCVVEGGVDQGKEALSLPGFFRKAGGAQQSRNLLTLGSIDGREQYYR